MQRRPVLGVVFPVLVALVASPVAATTNCSFTTVGTTMYLDDNCATDATIFVPDGFTLDGQGRAINAVDPPSDHFRGAIVQNADGAKTMNVQNVKLRALGIAESVCDSGNDKLRGIALLGAGGTIRDARIVGLKQSSPNDCAEGSGIIANNLPVAGTHPATRSLLIENVKVREFQFVGIQVQGNIVARVQKNVIVGVAEPEIPPAGQFGIFVGAGAKVEIKENTIRQDDTSTNSNVIGILVQDASNNVIERNTIDGAVDGIFVANYCPAKGLFSNKNRIARNDLRVSGEGIILVARSLDPNSVCDAHVDNNTVDGNAITAVEGGPAFEGVFVGTQVYSGGFTPVANKNTIQNNTITGFQTGIIQSGDTKTVLKNNTIIP